MKVCLNYLKFKKNKTNNIFKAITILALALILSSCNNRVYAIQECSPNGECLIPLPLKEKPVYPLLFALKQLNITAKNTLH